MSYIVAIIISKIAAAAGAAASALASGAVVESKKKLKKDKMIDGEEVKTSVVEEAEKSEVVPVANNPCTSANKPQQATISDDFLDSNMPSPVPISGTKRASALCTR